MFNVIPFAHMTLRMIVNIPAVRYDLYFIVETPILNSDPRDAAALKE